MSVSTIGLASKASHPLGNSLVYMSVQGFDSTADSNGSRGVLGLPSAQYTTL